MTEPYLPTSLAPSCLTLPKRELGSVSENVWEIKSNSLADLYLTRTIMPAKDALKKWR